MADQVQGRADVTLVGIDIAKRYHAVSVERPDGRRERFRCQRPSVPPHWRSGNVPTGGHGFSPVVAMGFPRLSVVEAGHPLSACGFGEPEGVAVGDHHVGVV